MSFHSDHVWDRDEVAAGVWTALALKGEEVTPRRFIRFDMDRTLPEGDSREIIGPVTYDSIVVAKQPAGQVVDVCHNVFTHTIKEGERRWISLVWNRPWRDRFGPGG